MSSHLIRQDLLPVGVGYALVMIVLAAGLWAARRRVASRQPLTRSAGRHDRGWPALLWHVLADALGGYLLLAAVVVLYYFFVAKVGSNFLDSEFSGAAVMLAIALPIYLAATWLRLRRAASRSDSPKEDRNGQRGA
jgi:membrane protein implicated in regulation of membrane protease activity